MVEKICKLVVALMEPMVPDLLILSTVVEGLHMKEQIVEEKKEIVQE